MRYKHFIGERALRLYAKAEYVDVAKELLIEIINQIVVEGNKDGLDDTAVHDHSVAGLILLCSDIANDFGYLKLSKDLQDLSVKHGLSHLV